MTLKILEEMKKVCDAGGEHEAFHSFERYTVENYTSGEGLMEHNHSSVGFVDDVSGDFIEIAERIEDVGFANRIAASLNSTPRLIEALEWQCKLIRQMAKYMPDPASGLLAADDELRQILEGKDDELRP